MIQKKGILLILLISLSLNSSCSKLLGNLRRDLDDTSPFEDDSEILKKDNTAGGRWPEREYLNEDARGRGEPQMMGYPGRSYASEAPSEEVPSDLGAGSIEAGNQMPRRSYINSSNTPNLEPETKRFYKSGNRATRDDFIDQSQEEGSLWASNGQTNYYFTKNKVRSPGDFVTVAIENDLLKDIGSEIKRTLTPQEKSKELEATQEQFKNKLKAELQAKKDALTMSASAPDKNAVPGANASPSPQPSPDGTTGAIPPGAPSATDAQITDDQVNKLVPKATLADVNIIPSLEVKAGDTMMGEIIERYPNGNLKIKAVKRVQYKRGPPRLVSLVGIVRGSDINDETDVINSGKLYEYRVEVAH